MTKVLERNHWLSCGEAIALWLKGSRVWNAWVENNPGSSINFFGAKFYTCIKKGSVISFKGYIFPSGYTDFRGAVFGNKLVDFSGAQFNGGTGLSRG